MEYWQHRWYKQMAMNMNGCQIYKQGRGNRPLVVLLAGWQVRQWMMRPVALILARSGYDCWVVTYPVDILSTNVDQSARNLEVVATEVIEQLTQAAYDKVILFGSSLGSLLALMVGNTYQVQKIILNTTGHDLSEIVWSWVKTVKGFRQAILDQGYTQESLALAWHGVAPRQHIDNLGPVALLIYLAKRDQIIPYASGELLLGLLRKRGYSPQVVTDRWLFHTSTATKNLILFKTYLRFMAAS